MNSNKSSWYAFLTCVQITVVMLNLAIALLHGALLILVGYFVAGPIVRSCGLPVITGHLFSGIIGGPFMLQVITAQDFSYLQPLSAACLGCIAITAGAELQFSKLLTQRRVIIATLAGQIPAIFIIGTCAALLLWPAVPVLAPMPFPLKLTAASLVAVILISRSPASAIAVMRDIKAAGPFSRVVLGVSVIADGALMLAFTAAFQVALAVAKVTNYVPLSPPTPAIPAAVTSPPHGGPRRSRRVPRAPTGARAAGRAAASASTDAAPPLSTNSSNPNPTPPPLTASPAAHLKPVPPLHLPPGAALSTTDPSPAPPLAPSAMGALGALARRAGAALAATVPDADALAGRIGGVGTHVDAVPHTLAYVPISDAGGNLHATDAGATLSLGALLQTLAVAAMAIVVSVVIGAAAAAAFSSVAGLVPRKQELVASKPYAGAARARVVLVGALLYVGAFIVFAFEPISAETIGLPYEPMLACLAAGVFIVNYTQHGQSLDIVVSRFVPIASVIFFCIAGTSINARDLAGQMGIFVALFLFRLAGLYVGTNVGVAVCGIENDCPIQRKYRWMSYVTQAGVALGLSRRLASSPLPYGPALGPILSAVVVLNEIFGPVMLKVALTAVGEVGNAESGASSDDGV